MGQYLLELAKSCEDAGTEFVNFLGTLIPQISAPSVLQSVQAGLKFKLNHAKIKDFAAKLEKFRTSLLLATILALRTSADGQNAKILDHLKVLRSNNTHKDTTGLQSLEDLLKKLELSQSRALPKLDAVGVEIQRCLKQITSLRDNLPQSQEKEILKWLYFRQMSWRYEEVPLAYQKTFSWIFGQNTGGNSWDSFTSHLTTQEVVKPYFVNGKAGSGKSTLMKYIINEPRTQELLAKWAGTKQLLVLRFFFWNLGTPLQKTHVGIMRSFVHTILQKYPELIPSVFPQLYQGWKETDSSSEPTYTEIKQAFQLVLEKSAKFLRLCIFVDGIDEFDGDHRDLSLYLSSLASKDVKLVVSSRPISACLHVFLGCPTLRLQDLTKQDMNTYVIGNLASHSLMVQLTKRLPQEAGELVSEIKEKAEGVFLWVKLVVHLLIEGLEDGDTMVDLQNKLHLLPPDLKDLYRRMLSKMHMEHQIQAAEIFQLFHAWNTLIADQPFCTILLYLSTEPLVEALSRPVAPLPSESLHWLCQRTEARIRSRCCGLLEVHTKIYEPPPDVSTVGSSDHFDDFDTRTSVVNYLHRTVAEFLVSDDVWLEICAITDQSAFDPMKSLIDACISMVRIGRGFTDGDLSVFVDNVFAICRSASHMSISTLEEYITILDKVMYQHRYIHQTKTAKDSQQVLGGHWSVDFYPITLVPKAHHGKLRELSGTVSIAARTCLLRYIEAFSSSRAKDILSRYTLGVYALESWGDSTDSTSLHDRSDTLLYLLQNVCKAEDVGFGGSLWQCAIVVCLRLMKSVHSAEILRIFLSTARSPRLLMSQKITGLDGQAHDPMTLVRQMIHSTNTDIQFLGSELERVAFSASRTSVSDRFHEIVSLASASDHVRDRLRAMPVEDRPKRMAARSPPQQYTASTYSDCASRSMYSHLLTPGVGPNSTTFPLPNTVFTAQAWNPNLNYQQRWVPRNMYQSYVNPYGMPLSMPFQPQPFLSNQAHRDRAQSGNCDVVYNASGRGTASYGQTSAPVPSPHADNSHDITMPQSMPGYYPDPSAWPQQMQSYPRFFR